MRGGTATKEMIASRMREIREWWGLQQKEASNAILADTGERQPITYETRWSNYESAKAHFPDYVLVSAAHFYCVSLDWICGRPSGKWSWSVLSLRSRLANELPNLDTLGWSKERRALHLYEVAKEMISGTAPVVYPRIFFGVPDEDVSDALRGEIALSDRALSRIEEFTGVPGLWLREGVYAKDAAKAAPGWELATWQIAAAGIEPEKFIRYLKAVAALMGELE